MKNILFFSVFLFLSLNFFCNSILAQVPYTAKAYWNETNKAEYKKLVEKKLKGDSLNTNEKFYIEDYETYLANYFQRLPDAEKEKYNQLKEQWDKELITAQVVERQPDFEWRPKDRFQNGTYGFYYGTSIVVIGEIDNAASVGIPLIMAGLWQLGPVINPKKYEGIDVSTLRAGSTGKLLGLGYGLALGLTLGGDSPGTGKLAMGLSTIGSMAFGELAFQSQKKKHLTLGRIELIRHYGLLGPAIGVLSAAAANTDNTNLIGASLLAGGITGLLIGNKASRNYNYTAGDVDAIGSLTLLSVGLGATMWVESVQNNLNNNSSGLALIPAAFAIAGTSFGQKMVKGINLTQRQGSTISLSSGGAALMGLGIVAIAQSGSPAVWLGVPSALGLITHQIIFHKYKMKNLEEKIKLGKNWKYPVRFSMKVLPENILINKQRQEGMAPAFGSSVFSNPVVKLNFTF